MKRLKNFESRKKLICESNKLTIFDVISESVLPSPWKLKDDIFKKQSTLKMFLYDKKDVLRLSDKSWMFRDKFEKVPNDLFSLTFIISTANELDKIMGYDVDIQGSMCEFQSMKSNNIFEEYIWIDSEFKNDGESFSTLLEHELGHVWTSVLGYLNENETIGRTSFNSDDFPEKLNDFQRDVLFSFYKNDLNALKNDYDYILKNQSETGENWELSTSTDEIIKLLIEDYTLNFKDDDPKNYIMDLFIRLQNIKHFDVSKETLIKAYKSKSSFGSFKNVTYIENIIRRLFLILSFGTDEQITYLRNECFKEFGVTTTEMIMEAYFYAIDKKQS